jgi:hypothetical protein
MERSGPAKSEEDILDELLRNAEAMWGAERVQVLRPSLVQMAHQLWEVGRTVPTIKEDPAFSI